jgi:lipoprotein-anchoring transpeptidase ErfK/SrfK
MDISVGEKELCMSSKKNFRSLLLAGLMLGAAAPQASAQFWVSEPPAPAVKPKPQKLGKPLPKPAAQPPVQQHSFFLFGDPEPQPVVRQPLRAAPPPPARRQQAARPIDEDVVSPAARESLLEPEHGHGGATPGVAALPADADPNYSTPVDLDPGVNYKQTTQHVVSDPTNEPAGTLTINTGKRKLYYSLGDGQAVEYSIAVGKAGFAWKGEATVGRKAFWPGWTPPPEMIERRPELPVHMDGSMSNPLGARALYLFQGNKDTLFRIHGTNEPTSIGHAASSGCIRMMNADVIDLYGRVTKGAHVVVM